MEDIAVIRTRKVSQTGKRALSRKGNRVRQDALVISNDRAYFDAWFKIGSLYREKRRVLNKMGRIDLRNTMPRGQKARLKFSNEAIGRRLLRPADFQKNITTLDQRLSKAEKVFWDGVEKARKDGAKFVFEQMAELFAMSRFEKTVLLFFIYLEYHDIQKNICTEDELLNILDTDNCIYTRMLHAKFLVSRATLFENGLLESVEHRQPESARMEIALTNRAVRILSDGLNGGTPEVEEKKKGTGQNSDSVGYIKDPDYTMDDVLLRDDIKDKVKLFLDSFRGKKLESLGVKDRIKTGLGTVFLFYGPPGTGKSMLAQAIAQYVQKKVLMVEYPKIMDRWVGATDKNISSIFKAAQKDDLVIVLDEADTLLYNRGFAMQEHDIRFVNEMLQELERFKGIIILTTNMDSLLDQALERRVSLKVKFENPLKETRLGIWRSHLPPAVKLAGDVDLNVLARDYEFSGGNIKNAVLNALMKMVSRVSDTLLMEDLIFGAKMEKDGMFTVKSNPIGFIG